MIPIANKKIYDVALISKIKEHEKLKKLKNIIKNLRNLAQEDVEEFSVLKIKIFKEEKEEEIKPEFKIAAPIIGIQNFFEDLKKSSSKPIVKNDTELEGENTSSTVDDNEKEIKQIDSSDFGSD